MLCKNGFDMIDFIKLIMASDKSWLPMNCWCDRCWLKQQRNFSSILKDLLKVKSYGSHKKKDSISIFEPVERFFLKISVFDSQSISSFLWASKPSNVDKPALNSYSEKYHQLAPKSKCRRSPSWKFATCSEILIMTSLGLWAKAKEPSLRSFRIDIDLMALELN